MGEYEAQGQEGITRAVRFGFSRIDTQTSLLPD